MVGLAAAVFAVPSVFCQLPVFQAPLEHPAIQYEAAATHDAVYELNRRMGSGQTSLVFEGPQGYLRSVLEELRVPVESQTLIFSKTSLQAQRISPASPRALYFNDSVAVGWVREGPLLELAAFDSERGVVFYTLDQTPAARPRFVRTMVCLRCHDTALNVPGMLAGSHATAPDGAPRFHMGVFYSDHRSPYEERWGGKYVTGDSGNLRHMGRAMRFDAAGYLSPHSDVAALMVFDHQMHMTNLLVRAAWETRVAMGEGRAAGVIPRLANEVADYTLFVDEAPLPAPVRGSSDFAKVFAARGPSDSKGRGLRQLDLKGRLLRYPCSYMIYSEAFENLPGALREAVYQKMWQILSGRERSARYARLTAADRRAVIEILRATKPGLPAVYAQ
ncbi:MAG: hypothetical protein SFV51_15490 [Bryobacteraceae bacterium]|nr:hypothetical protein [Bryobacteraceae bacterium]